MSHILLLLGCFQSWTVSNDCTLTERFLDEDGDGYGSEGLSACEGSHPARFSQPQGGDCDDADPTVNPGATEACDGLDQDCDGAVDEGALVDFWADADGDGYGGGEPIQSCSDDPPFSPAATQGGDCADSDANVFPGADEACNDLDDDCDGSVDEEPVSGPTWYQDADSDGFGDPSTALVSCTEPEDTVSQGSDCDDTQATVFPGAGEICGDGLINDCDADAECRLEGESSLSAWDQVYPAKLGEGLGTSMRSGDLNGDGLDDLTVGTSARSSLGVVVVSFGHPTPQEVSFYNGANGTGFGSSHDIADLDGDDQLDLAVLADDEGVVYLFPGPIDPTDKYVPEGQASAELKFSPQASGRAKLLAPGDLDGDGLPELALSEVSDAQVKLYSGWWTEGTQHEKNLMVTYTSEGELVGQSMAAADLDGDGFNELAISSKRTAFLVDYDGVSAELTLEDAAVALPAPSRFAFIGQAGDLDGDGVASFWVSSDSRDDMGLWSGEEDWAALSLRVTLDGGLEIQGPVSGGQDMDGDGHIDVAFSVFNGTESGMCLSYGPFKEGALTPDYCATESGAQAGESLLLLPDIDGDAVPDLAVGDPSAEGADGAYYILYGQSI